MAPRNPSRLVSNRNGKNTIRYDVVWTLPYKEYARVGYTETVTWWLDSIHADDIAANKRFNLIADAVKNSNGSIIMLEIRTDANSATFSQKAMNRAGQPYTPPMLTEINPVSIDIDKAFKEFVKKYEEKNPKRQAAPVHLARTRPALRPKKRDRAGLWFMGGLAAVAASLFAVSWIFNVSLMPAGFNKPASGENMLAQRAMSKYGDYRVSNERPEGRAIVPLHDGSGKCEFYKIDQAARFTYNGKGECNAR